jgi:hypothetical protein
MSVCSTFEENRLSVSSTDHRGKIRGRLRIDPERSKATHVTNLLRNGMVLACNTFQCCDYGTAHAYLTDRSITPIDALTSQLTRLIDSSFAYYGTCPESHLLIIV